MMNKVSKKTTLTLTSLLVIGVMLVSTISAMAADGPFARIGELDITGGVYSVGTQVFVINGSTLCFDAAGLSLANCVGLVDGSQVEVKGNSVGTVYTATSVYVLTTVQGVLNPKTPLTVGGILYVSDPNIILPDFYEAQDTVEVTYKVVGTDKVALVVKLITSASTSFYEFEGKLKNFDDTTWTLFNEALNKEYTFDMTKLKALPVYFAIGDSFKVKFQIVGTTFYVTEILEQTVLVPEKVASSRCVDRVPKVPIGILDKIGSGNAVVAGELFCKGFGWGEIVLAFRYGEGSAYTPEMLLAMRAQGHGWGELKKLASGAPQEELVITSQNQNSNSDHPGISNKPEKQNKNGKPGNPGNNNGKGKNK